MQVWSRLLDDYRIVVTNFKWGDPKFPRQERNEMVITPDEQFLRKAEAE